MGKKDKDKYCPKCHSKLEVVGERKDGRIMCCSECGWTKTLHMRSNFKPSRHQKEIDLYED